MSKNDSTISEEQLDFIREMMNVGAGNAVTALQMLLQCPVDLVIPKVHTMPMAHVPRILDDPALLVTCVRMGMVGDVHGAMFFIAPEETRRELSKMAEDTLPGSNKSPYGRPVEAEFSAVVEMANILAGVYLGSIHDFCGLNIYHTVPVFAVDMIQALLDEELAKTSLAAAIVVENRFVMKRHHLDEGLAKISLPLNLSIVVENEFTLVDFRAKTLLVIVPSEGSLKPLVASLAQAKKAYGCSA